MGDKDWLTIGKLVRYKAFPHKELRRSGMVGLVVSGLREPDPMWSIEPDYVIDVMWNMDRGLHCPAGTICQEYPDEIEVLSESR